MSSSDVRRTLAELEAWLGRAAPALAGCFAAPAGDDAVRRAEAAVGRPLPEEYVAFLRVHDGQRFVPSGEGTGTLAPLFRAFELLPVRAALSEHEVVAEENRLWWPITCIYGSSWFHCVDAASGEILSVDTKDPDRRPVVAESFGAFLERLVALTAEAEVTDGGLELDDDALDALLGAGG